MMEIEDLITEMQAVKLAHPGLEVHEILRIFNIKALQELSVQINKLRTSLKK